MAATRGDECFDSRGLRRTGDLNKADGAPERGDLMALGDPDLAAESCPVKSNINPPTPPLYSFLGSSAEEKWEGKSLRQESP